MPFSMKFYQDQLVTDGQSADPLPDALRMVFIRHGQGIRCLYQGTFNVQDASHVVSDRLPGDPWWESGVDTVVAWHSLQMPAIFIRAMILPTALRGTISNIWASDGPPPQANWRLFHDEIITL